ncbi:hypothetical protein [Intrasporangium chromatireducens]|nr:hypothetical protein [Intrasporangium chromatireducens]
MRSTLTHPEIEETYAAELAERHTNRAERLSVRFSGFAMRTGLAH